MSNLPTSPFFVSYGGFEFPLETEPLEFSFRPVEDAAGRTYTHANVMLRVAFYYTVDEIVETSDDGMDDLRRRLMAPAGELIVEGVGFGPYHINKPDGTGMRDVKWGPKPQIESCVYKGGERCWKVVWSVVAAIPICPPDEEPVYKKKVMEYCFTVQYGVQAGGLGRRVYDGFIRIPQTRKNQGARTLDDNADNYRDLIVPPYVADYRRLPATYSLSEDKCVLRFNIVDEQLPSWAPPEWCIEPPAVAHRVQSMKEGFVKWSHFITGEYSIVKGVDRAWGWEHFRGLLEDKIKRIKASLAADKSAHVRLVSLAMAEPEVYGSRSCAFSAQLIQISNVNFTSIFNIFGGDIDKVFRKNVPQSFNLWVKPPGGDDWLAYAYSMDESGAWTARGLSEMAFANEDDIIIDLCEPKKPREIKGDQPGDRRLSTPNGRGLRTEPAPPPEGSWLKYEGRIKVEERDGTALHVTLPDNERSLRTAPPDPKVNDTAGHFPKNYQKAPAHVTQVSGAPLILVRFSGAAARIGYEITPPRLEKYMGVNLVQYGIAEFNTQLIRTLDGPPIVAAAWDFLYALTEPPKEPARTPSSPVYGPAPGGRALRAR